MEKDKTPLVSVIIPVWERAHLLNRTITSVLNQDYPNKEIIVVDDGSTEDIAAALKSYPEIKFIKLPKHQGQVYARNAGLDAAKGEYIQNLDSDDELFPGKIKKQIEFLEANPNIDFVNGDLIAYKEGEEPRPFNGTAVKFDMKRCFIRNIKRHVALRHSLNALFTPNMTHFYLSIGVGIYRKNDLRFSTEVEDNFGFSSDQEFWCQMVLADKKFAYLPGKALKYNMHADTVTGRRAKNPEGAVAVRKFVIDKLLQRLKREHRRGHKRL